MNTVSSWQPLG